jgi:hypothetical protein
MESFSYLVILASLAFNSFGQLDYRKFVLPNNDIDWAPIIDPITGQSLFLPKSKEFN